MISWWCEIWRTIGENVDRIRHGLKEAQIQLSSWDSQNWSVSQVLIGTIELCRRPFNGYTFQPRCRFCQALEDTLQHVSLGRLGRLSKNGPAVSRHPQPSGTTLNVFLDVDATRLVFAQKRHRWFEGKNQMHQMPTLESQDFWRDELKFCRTKMLNCSQFPKFRNWTIWTTWALR